MKKFLSLLLALIFALSLASCAVEDTEDGETSDSDSISATESDKDTDTEKETEGDTVTPRSDVHSLTNDSSALQYVKTYGRTQATNLGITCDFSATGIEFTAKTRGKVTLTVKCLNQSIETNKNDDIYFTVYIDGVRSATRLKAYKNSTTTLTLADFSAEGVHTIKVLKQSEIKNGLCFLTTLNFEGEFGERPADNAKYIEFIGDSITSGYGNLTSKGTEPANDTDYKDATQAYAYLTAEALGADHSLVSCAGVGITGSWRPMLAMDLYTKQSYYRNQDAAFTPTRTADLVVINLGTNDESKSANTTQYKSDVKTLIAKVQEYYGANVKIVWVYGMMGEGYGSYALEAINELKAAGTGDNIYSVRLSQNNAGAGNHPIATAHKTAATELVDFINSNNLLG